MRIVATTRRSLLSAIKDPANRKAWDEFYKIYSGFIRGIAKGKNLMDDEVEDVTSIVFTQIFKGKLKYDPGKGRFRSLLATAVRRRATDTLRKRYLYEKRMVHHASNDTRSTGTVTRIADEHTPHDVGLAKRESDEMAMRMAWSDVQQKRSPLQCQIFSEHVLHHNTVTEVMKKLGVTVHQVYSAKSRVGKVYREALKAAAYRLDHPDLPKPEKPNERK